MNKYSGRGKGEGDKGRERTKRRGGVGREEEREGEGRLPLSSVFPRSAYCLTPTGACSQATLRGAGTKMLKM